jgi:intracellular septation protein
MKLLIDFFPILLFFISYKFFGIYVATGVAIGTSFIQVGWHWIRNRKFEMMQVVTLIILVVLGGATLTLHNELFIKWKPTAINWIFATVFLCSHLTKTTIIQRLMQQNISLPRNIWQRLNFSWVVFFFLTGLANIYVVYHFDTNTWVNFKLFGLLGLTILFVILQAIFLAKHVKSDVK